MLPPVYEDLPQILRFFWGLLQLFDFPNYFTYWRYWDTMADHGMPGAEAYLEGLGLLFQRRRQRARAPDGTAGSEARGAEARGHGPPCWGGSWVMFLATLW